MNHLNKILITKKRDVDWQQKTRDNLWDLEAFDTLPFAGAHPTGPLRHGRKVHIIFHDKNKTLCGRSIYSRWKLSSISKYGEEHLCKNCHSIADRYLNDMGTS